MIPLLKHYAKCHKAKSKQSNGLHQRRLDSNVSELHIITIKVNHLALTPSQQTALTNYGRALVFPKRPADYHKLSKWEIMLALPSVYVNLLSMFMVTL